MKLSLITLLLLVCAGCSNPTPKPMKASPSTAAVEDPFHCAIIHEPEQGCPAGYIKELKPRFTERDGSQEFACVSADKDPCTDLLRPGETMEVHINLQLDQAIESPKI